MLMFMTVDSHLVAPDPESATLTSSQTHRPEGTSPRSVTDPFPSLFAIRHPGGVRTRPPRHPHLVEQPSDCSASRLQPHLRNAILLLYWRRPTVSHT